MESPSSESSDRGTRKKQRRRITSRKARKPDRTFALPVPASVEDFAAWNHGTHVPDLTYDNERNTTLFGYIYLMKKYHSKCFVPGQLRYKAGKLKYVVQGNIYKKARVLGADLLNCAGPVFIPLEIRVSTDSVAHANLLIYRPSKGIVERFEPTFTQYAEFEPVNAQLKKLFEELEPAARFVSAPPQCPGLQEVEEEGSPFKDEEGIGYCQMWCFFVMETILMNPEMETADIIKECFRVSESNPRYLRRLIQGYTFNFSKEMETAIQFNIKKKGINKFVMTQSEKDRVYLEAFETAAYHRDRMSGSTPNSTPRSSSEGDPDLKHTPLRDLEALLQFTRGNYNIFERPVRPTKQRKEYVRKINQFLDLHRMGLDELWGLARAGWEKAEKYELNLDDPFHDETKFIIPEFKYAGTKSLSELHAFTKGHDLSNIKINKSRQEYSDEIQDYLDKNQMILSELWEAAEEKWGRTSVSA